MPRDTLINAIRRELEVVPGAYEQLLPDQRREQRAQQRELGARATQADHLNALKDGLDPRPVLPVVEQAQALAERQVRQDVERRAIV